MKTSISPTILKLITIFAVGFGIISSISTGGANMFERDSQGRKIIRPINERFTSLQAYLDWTNNSRIMDLPKYKEVSKGYYKYQRSRGQARDDTIYSYEDLRKKLGFSR